MRGSRRRRDAAFAEGGGEFLDRLLGAGEQVGDFRAGDVFGLLRGEIAGECVEDAADHQFLALGLAFAGGDIFLQRRRESFALEERKYPVHGAERLREIVNDAVQQDLFLLDFL